jgi:hypothetical protein
VPACAGDCDDSGDVTVNELILGLASALYGQIRCPACDRNRDGVIAINELVSAVNSALQGCPTAATPTATAPVTLAAIQQTIFSPRCAIPTCHNAATRAGGLILDPEHAYADLVGVQSLIPTELLRVDAGRPDESFLLVKLDGPPPGQGSRMPLGGPFLSAAEVQLIRDWIAQGARP